MMLNTACTHNSRVKTAAGEPVYQLPSFASTSEATSDRGSTWKAAEDGNGVVLSGSGCPMVVSYDKACLAETVDTPKACAECDCVNFKRNSKANGIEFSECKS